MPPSAFGVQRIGDAVARLLARAQHRRRLQEKGAIHDPQTAVAGRADLEDRHALFDFARLPDIADGRIHQGLDSRVGHLHAAKRQRRFFPILDGVFARRQGLLERGRVDRNFPAAAVKQKEPGSLARRHRQGFELDSPAIDQPGQLQRTGRQIS